MGALSKSVFKTQLTANDATAQEELGAIRQESGKFYKYVQAVDLALANGDAVEIGSTAVDYKVTQDRAGGSSIGRVPAGVAIGTITANYYGWIQIKGVHTSVKSDGSVSKGEAVVPHASTNGTVDSAAVGSTVAITAQQALGFAMADDTTSRAVVYIDCL